ncbi:MAG: ankyrin repeat domain-containing protein, partial [Planctomycetia bacterium]
MAKRSPEPDDFDDAVDYVLLGPSAAALTAYLKADPERGFAYAEGETVSPLHVAAMFGRLDLVRVLVAFGQDPNYVAADYITSANNFIRKMPSACQRCHVYCTSGWSKYAATFAGSPRRASMNSS